MGGAINEDDTTEQMEEVEYNNEDEQSHRTEGHANDKVYEDEEEEESSIV